MKGSYAMDLCRDAIGWLKFAGPTANIDFGPNISAGSGSTVDFAGEGKTHVIVGIAGYDESVDMRAGEALAPFVALFHEVAGHAMQLEHEFQNPTPLGNALFLSHYACKGSPRYSGVDDDGNLHPAYFRCPHEIAAQYMGIKCATEYLEYAVGPEKAKAWMLDYVRYRVENKCEFLPGAYRQDEPDGRVEIETPEEMAARYKREADVIMTKHPTVDAVLRVMDKEFQRVLRKQRIFDTSHKDGDALELFADVQSGFDVRKAIGRCKYGIRQDAMMAVAYLGSMKRRDLNGISCMTSREAFKAVDLDAVHVFSGFGDPLHPAPKGKYASLERLMAITGDPDKTSKIERRSDAPDY